MKPERLCDCGCGKPARKSGRMSSACYMRKYRRTKTGREAVSRANRRQRLLHPEKARYHDTVYKREWRERTHQRVPPEVRSLHRAVKRLERALANADEH